MCSVFPIDKCTLFSRIIVTRSAYWHNKSVFLEEDRDKHYNVFCIIFWFFLLILLIPSIFNSYWVDSKTKAVLYNPRMDLPKLSQSLTVLLYTDIVTSISLDLLNQLNYETVNSLISGNRSMKCWLVIRTNMQLIGAFLSTVKKLYFYIYCIAFIISLELKAQMSFSDRPLSVMCLSVCKLFTFSSSQEPLSQF